MIIPRILFLGGNGHCAARLDPARAVMTGEAPFELWDTAYPGFEGRPRSTSLPEFLDSVRDRLEEATEATHGSILIYATGIGALLALCLRARGEIVGRRLLFQAPVLWGLERRLMPRLMRLRPVQAAAHRVFATRPFRKWFERRHLPANMDPALVSAFHEGYARCAALPDLFRWMNPSLLRRLEVDLVARRGALDEIAVWWGDRDRVVTPTELRLTEGALGRRWPLRVFRGWGHYPMLEDPRGWVEALAAVAQPPPTGGRNTSSSPSSRAASNGA